MNARCYWQAATLCRVIWKVINGYAFICNLLIQQASIKGPVYFRNCARLSTKMSRGKASTTALNVSRVCFMQALGKHDLVTWSSWTSWALVIKWIALWGSCILWSICLAQGTVHIAPFDCVVGEQTTFWGSSLFMMWMWESPMGWWLGDWQVHFKGWRG